MFCFSRRFVCKTVEGERIIGLSHRMYFERRMVFIHAPLFHALNPPNPARIPAIFQKIRLRKDTQRIFFCMSFDIPHRFRPVGGLQVFFVFSFIFLRHEI